MGSEKELITNRRAKLDRMRQSANAYPNDFKPDQTIANLYSDYQWLIEKGPGSMDETGGKPVRIAGRLLAIRVMGKASFASVQDRSGKIQVLVKRDLLGADAYQEFKSWDVGDIVGVEGTMLITRTGELTIGTVSIRLLTKCLRPLPEKWHGLSDLETRYRQRYLDLIVTPESRDVFRVRSKVVRYIRRYLEDRDYIEVETPMMHHIAGGAAAKPFKTHHNALDMDLYLRIAPELYLKRLVVGGFERVYELNRNFRNEGISTMHNPEFSMLEFYQAYATYHDLMDLTEDLVCGLVKELTGGETTLPWKDQILDFAAPWQRVSMAQSLVRWGGLDEETVNDPARVLEAAKEHEVSVSKDWGPGKVLSELFDKLVEPQLIQPTFITDFPLEISPLSRKKDENPELVDRFELFIAGREIANAFSELNDPDDQRERFEQQLQARSRGDQEAHPMDEDYITALEFGMPPTAGEGIGIDRLVMLMTNSQSIRDVILFPQLRPKGDANT